MRFRRNRNPERAQRIEGRLDQIRERIERACQRGGRSPTSVTLVAVTKGVPPELIAEAVALGVTDVGENRVQEAATKRQEIDTWLRARGSGLGAVALSSQPRAQSAFQIRWHLIGHLQRNKAARAVELFEMIHSVDSMALVDELERQAAQRGRNLKVLVQVNVSGETTKNGCPPGQAETLAGAVRQTAHLSLAGLMTLAPFGTDPQQARPHFAHLRRLRDEAASALSLAPSALSLSMGMSQDFEVAIEEGADMVRIGTALFGAQSSAVTG